MPANAVAPGAIQTSLMRVLVSPAKQTTWTTLTCLTAVTVRDANSAALVSGRKILHLRISALPQYKRALPERELPAQAGSRGSAGNPPACPDHRDGGIKCNLEAVPEQAAMVRLRVLGLEPTKQTT